MRSEKSTLPDLLRRFTPTPYVFLVAGVSQSTYIRSNDLDMALKMRQLCLLLERKNQIIPLEWKVIRDVTHDASSANTFSLHHGPLKTIHHGVGTVLAYDEETGELIGFVSANMDSNRLVNSLIPALFEF
jgi:hypothetical protein